MKKLQLLSSLFAISTLLTSAAANAETAYRMKMPARGIVVQSTASVPAPAVPTPPVVPVAPVVAELTIQEASYGANRGAVGNATAAIAAVCNTKVSCTVDPYALIGDPYPGVVKDLQVRYLCGATPHSYSYTQTEAGNRGHTLTCA